MANNSSQSRDRLRSRKGISGKEARQQPADPDSRAAFKHIQQERGRAKSLPARAQHVGGADVSATDRTDVLIAEKPHKQVSRWYGSKQVSHHHNQKTCEDHDETEFSR